MNIKDIVYQLVSLFLGQRQGRHFGVFTQLAQQVADLLKKDYKEKAREYLTKATIFITCLFIGLFALMNSIKNGEDLIRPLPNGPLILFSGYLVLTLVAFGGIFFLLKKDKGSVESGKTSREAYENEQKRNDYSGSHQKHHRGYSVGAEVASIISSFVTGFSSGLKRETTKTSSASSSSHSSRQQTND